MKENDPPCLVETLLTQGKDVPQITAGGIRYLMSYTMPDDLVVCNFKFASESIKMREKYMPSESQIALKEEFSKGVRDDGPETND